MQKTQQQIANEKQLKQLNEKYQLLKTIITPSGFYNVWFNSLPNFKTNEDAFNDLNEKYFNIVGEYRYSKYSNFLNVNRYRKK